jgi:cytochrome c-type biogenesis protein CcmH
VNRLIVLIACLACSAAFAAAPDPELERRVAAVSEQLRCLVCQNQTIADSQAELAVDLRGQVRDQLARGMSEREVIDFVVQRYGDFVLYRPPVRRSTWLLWFGPLVLLVGGAAGYRLLWSRRPAPAVLAPAERLRAARLLDGRDDP